MSLFKKIIIPITIIIILMQFTMGFILIASKYNAAFDESNKSMKNNIVIIERSFNQLIDDFSVIGRMLSKNESVIDYIDNPHTKDETLLNKVDKLLSDTLESSSLFNNVFILPYDGFVTINAIEGYGVSKYDLRDRQSYIKMSNSTSGEIVVEKPRAGAVNNRAISNIYVAKYNQTGFVGAVGMPISMHQYIKEVVLPSVTDKDLIVYLFDASGNIFGAQDEEKIYNDKYNIAINESKLFDTVLENKNGFANYHYNNMDTWVNYSYIEIIDSYIILIKDTAGFKKSQRLMTLTSLIISMSLLIIVFLVFYFVVKGVTKPIYTIVKYSEAVSNKNLAIKVDENLVTRKDEIGALAIAFRKMLLDLNMSFTRLEEKNREIEFLAYHDSLTKLFNRRYFRNEIGKKIIDGVKGSVIMIDLDNFKLINDSMGHLAGDKVLRAFSNVLLNIVGPNDLVVRFGGDEFILWVLSDTASEIISRLSAAMKSPLQIDELKVDVRFSAGISKYPMDSKSLDKLIRYSDLALYHAKSKGKDCVVFFEPSMEHDIVNKLKIEKVLDSALKNDGFHIVYQPLVELESGDVIGYEALLRLDSNEYSPGVFIKSAEETGQIIDIGRMVVDKVLSQLEIWHSEKRKIYSISINYSIKQLKDEGFVEYVLERLEYYGLEAKWIEFEVTENIFISHLEDAIDVFRRFRMSGIGISIDDFGTGYSSLTYVINLPVNKIKIDKSICDILLCDSKLEIMRSLIMFAHSIKLKIVAEGIEDRISVLKLKTIKCDIVQGYYFSKPLENKLVYNKDNYEI